MSDIRLRLTLPTNGWYSAILIRSAIVGYAQQPDFQLLAPGQRTMAERIEWEMSRSPGEGVLRKAIELEGLENDWKDAYVSGGDGKNDNDDKGKEDGIERKGKARAKL